MRRPGRILLLAALALCLGAQSAAAVPSHKLDDRLEDLWTTLLLAPSAENPPGTHVIELTSGELSLTTTITVVPGR